MSISLRLRLDVVAEATDDELREFLMQCAQKRFRTERPLLLRRHDGEERIRIDVQVPHLYHLNRQLPEKCLPGCKLLRPIVETGEIQEIQRNINATFQRIADRGFDILKVIAGTIICGIAFSARANNGNAQEFVFTQNRGYQE